MTKGSLTKNLILGAAIIAASLSLSGLVGAQLGVQAATGQQPVVVELFTSQGCSSCPPADAVLGELADRDDVIALSLPVDYWDSLGWRDTLAAPAHTQRQRTYARQLGTRRVYTPQMVINGAIDVVGSRRADVLAHIAAEKVRPHDTIAISLARSGDTLTIALSDAPPALSGQKAAVWIVPYHKGNHTVMIKAGENKGRTISYSNVVEGLKRLGSYDGTGRSYNHALAPLQNKDVDGCAVIIQIDATGAIIGAQRIDLEALE